MIQNSNKTTTAPSAARMAATTHTAPPTQRSDVFAQRHRLRVGTFVALIVLLIGSVLVSTALGQYYLSLPDLLRILASRSSAETDIAASVVWDIRLPRIFLGFLVGAALGVATGSIISSVLSNGLLEGLPGLNLFLFDPVKTVLIILSVMVIAFLAGTIPAMRAARQDPINALRYE